MMWMIRSNGGSLLPLWFDNNIVAIGWCANFSFEGLKKEEIKKILQKEIHTYINC